MLLDSTSQLDKAAFSTLVSKATNSDFDELCRMYGLPRIQSILTKYWRQAMLQGNFAKRDAAAVVFRFVREALRGQDHSVPVYVSADPARIHRVYAYPGYPFTQSDFFRFWEIADVIYYSTGGTVDYLELCPWISPWNAACDWSKVPGVPDTVPGDAVAAKRLPFLLRGYAGKAELVMEDASTVPPTYLQDFVSANIGEVPLPGVIPYMFTASKIEKDCTLSQISLSEYTTVTMSVGVDSDVSVTHAVKMFVNDALVFTGSTPGVFTLSDGREFTYLTAGLDLTDGGVNFTGVNLSVGTDSLLMAGTTAMLDLTPARGGNWGMELYLDGMPTGITILLEAADKSASAFFSLPAYAGQTVSFVFIGDPADMPAVALHNAVASVLADVPAMQPLGGNLLAGPAEGDNPSTGPYPIYLEGGQADDWYAILDAMVALGVEPIARISTHLNSD